MGLTSTIALAFTALASTIAFAGPIQVRSNTVTAKFDDIPNGFSITSPYASLTWTNFIVSSPDRSTPSYVAYASAFQYARVINGSSGSIGTSSTTSDFLISSLRYACSARNDNSVNPGPPKACTITIKEQCVNAAQSRTVTVKYTPSGAVAKMGTLSLATGRKCTKGKGYVFQSSGPDLLLDNVVLVENNH